ncbi:polyprenyl synthetase family protein [Salipiger sp.]|uniref:polyprenyl synthetase family protein n=1 Tax=Salipiger sp. TaxID=2078585 RepID=UPI003A97F9AA
MRCAAPDTLRGRLRLSSGTGDALDEITGRLLAEDFARYEVELSRALSPQAPYLGAEEQELYRRGKRIRPMLLMLSARMIAGDGPLPAKVIKAAVSLEMLHVATLIHDDIIDDAMTRRGIASVNARHGTNAAILLGDMQFVQAIRTFTDAIETETEMGLVKLVLDTAFRICAGELDELRSDPGRDPVAQRERYMEVIERKTAIMFGLACETGVALVEGRTGQSRRAGFYGRRVGRAFQIFDDLMDILQAPEGSGKGRGTDLARRTLSLPLIFAMEELGPDHLVSRILRGAEATPAELAQGVEAVIRSGAPARAWAEARLQALDAETYLRGFAESPWRDALRTIALVTVNRAF